MRRTLIAAALVGMTLVPSLSQAADPKIERAWKAKCASCHGSDGKGATEQGKKQGVADMTTADFQKKFSDADMTKAIAEGLKREKDGKKQDMQAYKGKLPDDQIAGLVSFIRGLKK